MTTFLFLFNLFPSILTCIVFWAELKLSNKKVQAHVYGFSCGRWEVHVGSSFRIKGTNIRA